MTPDFGEVAARESRIGGAACKSSGSPDPRCTGRLRFFVWKQPFRSGPYCGDTCCPPTLGEKAGRISVAGARLRFAEPSQSGRRLCCKASCPNASLHSYPDDVSGAAVRCVVRCRQGKPHSAAECRSPKFVEFRRRWTLSSSERPLKYIKGYLG